MRRFTCVAMFCGYALLTGAARGADQNPYAVRAEALFDEGRRLMASGDYASACPKFADSQALDPAPGTALNLAFCYERAGKLASAWASFRTAEASARAAGQKSRAALAKRKADDLQPKLSRLTVSVSAQVQVPGLELRSNGEVLLPPEWGFAIPHDGGGFDIQATAPGKKTWSAHVELEPMGRNLVVEVPLLEDLPPPAMSAATTPGLAKFVEPPAVSALESIERSIVAASPPLHVRRSLLEGTQHKVGLAIGAAGILGMGAAGIVGIAAKSKFVTAEGESGAGRHSDSVLAFNAGNVGTLVLGISAIVTLVGAGVWASAPTATSVTVGTNGTTLQLQGRFR